MRLTTACLCLAALAFVPGVGRSGEGAAVEATPPSSWRVAIDKLETPAWRQAIERLTATRAFKPGQTPVTLVRVVLEGAEPKEQAAPELDAPMVNGVRLRVTGGEYPGGLNRIRLQRAKPLPRNAPISASSTKLNTLDSFPQGGGMYRQLNSGDFIIVEHINSTSRRGGRDPVSLRTSTHGQADLWVPVPPPGELGIFGEVILSEVDRSTYGRIIAEVRSSGTALPRPKKLQVGLVTVGGPYGDSYPMTNDAIATTRLLAPGAYQILLPTNETSGTPTNRWTVAVQPGRVTYLMFTDPGEGEIEMVSSKAFAPSDPMPSPPE